MPDLFEDVRANGSSSAVFVPKTPWFFVGNGAEASTTALVEARLRSNLRVQLAYQTSSDGLDDRLDGATEKFARLETPSWPNTGEQPIFCPITPWLPSLASEPGAFRWKVLPRDDEEPDETNA